MRALAKIIRLPRSDMPAPAFTDFSRIYVAREANRVQDALLVLHEQAHIWLNHKTRRPDDFGTESFDKTLWDCAMEMEIARNIYTQKDDDEISKPMTILSGAFLRDSFPSMPPDLLLAEEIYDWLKKNPQEVPSCAARKFCACSEHGDEDGDEDDEDATSGKISAEEMKEIKAGLEKLAETMETEAKKITINSIKVRKPSLAGEIDHILRSRKVKNRTYMRPSRREAPPFILRGSKKLKKVPLVEIFVDRSGSMSGEKTAASVGKLKKVLAQYRASVECDVFYFSNGRIYNHDVPPNGGNPYPLVMAHLEKSRPKVAIIITDYDLEETRGLTPLSHRETKILCVPVCAERTAIANLIGAKDVF